MECKSIPTRNGSISVASVAVAVFAAIASGASAQSVHDRSAAGAVTRVDAYGNAQPAQRERLRIGRFANPAERIAFRGYQSEGRRRNRRGGLIPFAITGDVFARGTAARRNPFRPGGSLGLRFGLPGSFWPQYQRLGRNNQPNRAGDIALVFARKYTLIQGSSLSALVDQAIEERRVPSLLPSSVYGVPFVAGQTTTTVADAPGLGDQLRLGINRSHRQARAEAWLLFRAGAYRQAARGFEAAAILEPTDLESRIGALFSYLSVRAMRTSLAVLGEIARRHPNPFVRDLNVSDRFGNMMESRQLQIGTRLFTESGRGSDPASALQALVLWYLGQRRDALAAAEPLKAAGAGSVFAGWPTQMEALISSDTASTVPSP